MLQDCFASLAMTKILKFPSPCLPQLDWGISISNSRIPKKKPPNPQKNKGILEFLGKDLYSKSFFKLFLKKNYKKNL